MFMLLTELLHEDKKISEQELDRIAQEQMRKSGSTEKEIQDFYNGLCGRIGYTTDCKSVYAGSSPVRDSNKE